jgi:hypothetical protein
MSLSNAQEAKLEAQGYVREMRGERANCGENRALDTREMCDAREVGAARAREDQARSNYEKD